MNAEDDLRLQTENIDLRRLLAQAGIDAAEHKVLESLQRLLVEELHHRVKNMLATVMAITSQSLRTAGSVEDGRQAIEQLLMAFGRVHELLLKTTWTSAKLGSILATALEPFDTGGDGKFFIQTSDIDVSSGAVLPLAMVLNELCTNAAKYGALSNVLGRVEVTAVVDEPLQQFRLTWTERDGPKVSKPTRRSFGTRLIEQSFVNQLKGEAQLTFEPSGVICILDIPLESLKLPS
jgi:two-component sensor histidine kinase